MGGEQRLRHGYTNATTTDGRRVVKRYVGPDAVERQQREVSALTSLAGRLPVPPLLEHQDGQITMGFVAGLPGQELLTTAPDAVLHTVGRTARQLQQIDVESGASFSADRPDAVLVHGDFGPHNMIFEASTAEPTAIVDWELTDVGDPIEDIAWAEWVVRFHHADLVHALPALFDGYQAQPPWPRRQAAMLAKCRALDLVQRLRIDNDAEAGLWQRRIDTTAAFRE
jgi:tRNA A-37 threonylcarbamoyl transferase component Bud32